MQYEPTEVCQGCGNDATDCTTVLVPAKDGGVRYVRLCPPCVGF